MVQRRKNFRFPPKSSQAFFIFGELVGQDLDRHIPTKLPISCAIDLTHPAFADGLEDLVVGEFVAG